MQQRTSCYSLCVRRGIANRARLFSHWGECMPVRRLPVNRANVFDSRFANFYSFEENVKAICLIEQYLL